MKRATMSDINAFLDGVLDDSQRREVEAAIEGDAEAKALLNFHRQQVEQLHRLYDPVLYEPVPRRMIDMLRRHYS
jgi:anti-sigma factor RsiW